MRSGGETHPFRCEIPRCGAEIPSDSCVAGTFPVLKVMNLIGKRQVLPFQTNIVIYKNDDFNGISIFVFFSEIKRYFAKKVNSDFSYSLAYLTLK